MPSRSPNLAAAESTPILQSESPKSAAGSESENPISEETIFQSESTKSAAGLEFENPISEEATKDRRASKKSKSDELGHEFHWRDSASASVEEGAGAAAAPTKSEGTVEESGSSGRERLKRHRVEVAGRVWIPEMWGQEDFLKDWIDCTVFDAALRNSGIMSARASLMEEGRRANSTRFRIDNIC